MISRFSSQILARGQRGQDLGFLACCLVVSRNQEICSIWPNIALAVSKRVFQNQFMFLTEKVYQPQESKRSTKISILRDFVNQGQNGVFGSSGSIGCQDLVFGMSWLRLGLSDLQIQAQCFRQGGGEVGIQGFNGWLGALTWSQDVLNEGGSL